MALRGEDAEGDKRRLTRQRDPKRLDHHDGEQQRQPVMSEEVGHVYGIFPDAEARTMVRLPAMLAGPRRVQAARALAELFDRRALLPAAELFSARRRHPTAAYSGPDRPAQDRS